MKNANSPEVGCSEIIHVRIDKEMKDELINEMKNLGLKRISTYLRLIISKRKTRIKSSSPSEGPTKKDFNSIANEYSKILSELKKLGTMKNQDGTPVLNQTLFNNQIKALNERTTEMVRLLKKTLNDY